MNSLLRLFVAVLIGARRLDVFALMLFPKVQLVCRCSARLNSGVGLLS
jgi:hypothetical protein